MSKPSASIPKSEPSVSWEDEEWVHFKDAAEAYANFVEVSTGVAQCLLREQCASGEIRSIRYTSEPGLGTQPNAVLLKPSEWVENPYLDFEADCVIEDDPFEDQNSETNLQSLVRRLSAPTLKKSLEEVLPPRTLAPAPVASIRRGPPLWTYIDVSEDDVVYWIIQAKPQVSLPPNARQGKIPKIKAMLAKLYPAGVPDPAICSRKELQGQLVKDDPTLTPLDPKTLRNAIDEYNAETRDRKRPGGIGNPGVSH